MTARPSTHRAATLKRRSALLAAAIELVAERGIEGVTHREVARRAGVPASTTTYFFASIDELVLEAVREVLDQLSVRLDALIEQLRSAPVDGGADDPLDAVVPLLLAAPLHHVSAQFHAYLAAAHRDAWQADVADLFASLEAAVAAVLVAAGQPATRGRVRSVIALVDGFQLQRLAGVDPDALEQDLRDGLRSLLGLDDIERRSATSSEGR